MWLVTRSFDQTRSMYLSAGVEGLERLPSMADLPPEIDLLLPTRTPGRDGAEVAYAAPLQIDLPQHAVPNPPRPPGLAFGFPIL